MNKKILRTKGVPSPSRMRFRPFEGGVANTGTGNLLVVRDLPPGAGQGQSPEAACCGGRVWTAAAYL